VKLDSTFAILLLMTPAVLAASKSQNTQPFNPSWAIRALVSYDNWLMQRIKAVDPCQKMAFTLSAYNGGLGWINRDKKLATRQGLNPQYWFEQVETVNAGRSQANWKENRHYPKNILYNIAPRYLSWGSGSCIQ